MAAERYSKSIQTSITSPFLWPQDTNDDYVSEYQCLMVLVDSLRYAKLGKRAFEKYIEQATGSSIKTIDDFVRHLQEKLKKLEIFFDKIFLQKNIICIALSQTQEQLKKHSNEIQKSQDQAQNLFLKNQKKIQQNIIQSKLGLIAKEELLNSNQKSKRILQLNWEYLKLIKKVSGFKIQDEKPLTFNEYSKIKPGKQFFQKSSIKNNILSSEQQLQTQIKNQQNKQTNKQLNFTFSNPSKKQDDQTLFSLKKQINKQSQQLKISQPKRFEYRRHSSNQKNKFSMKFDYKSNKFNIDGFKGLLKLEINSQKLIVNFDKSQQIVEEQMRQISKIKPQKKSKQKQSPKKTLKDLTKQYSLYQRNAWK